MLAASGDRFMAGMRQRDDEGGMDTCRGSGFSRDASARSGDAMAPRLTVAA